MNKDQFKAICRKSQDELKSYVVTKLKKHYDKIHLSKDFVYAEGSVPICLVAHMDTVHKESPKTFVFEGDKISSPQGIGGDDRCGVYAILQIIQKHNCSVLFCCDEEIGGIGAQAFSHSSFAEKANFQYIIELDRKGKTDAVFYDCDNPDFTKFITSFGPWEEDYGSFSDICFVAPAVGCAAVNLSVGYYNQHTLKEYVVPSEVDYCVDNVCALIEATTEKDDFEYIEADYTCSYGRGYYGSGYRDYRCKDYSAYEDYYGSYSDDYKDVYFIQYVGDDGKHKYAELEAFSRLEAVGKLMEMVPTLCYNNIFDIINESSYCASSK